MKKTLPGFLSPLLLLLSTSSFSGQPVPNSVGAGLSISQDAGDIAVEWFGASGQFYFLESSSDLVNWSWIAIHKIGEGEVLDHRFGTDTKRLFLRLHSSDDPSSDLLSADFSGTKVSNWETIQLGLDPFAWEDTSGNGLPDAWELYHFGRLGVDPDADPDGDGLTNFEEFQHGADPNRWDSNSLLPVEIKVSSADSPTGSAPKYKNSPKVGSADNLFSVWPGEGFTVNIQLRDSFQSPPDFIRWNVSGEDIANNSREHTFNWSTPGTNRIEIEVGELTFEVWVNVPYVGTVTRAQAIATLPPWATARIGHWASVAIDYSNEHYPVSPKRDAMRHAYWAALSASDAYITQEQILYFSTAYEFDNKWNDSPPQQAFNSTMDLYNNLIGSMVQISRPTLPPSPNTVKIIQTLEQKYAAGEFWIYDGDTSQGASDGIILKSNSEKIYPVN